MPSTVLRVVPYFTAVAMVGAILALRAYPLVDLTPALVLLMTVFVVPLLVMAYVSRGSDRSAKLGAFAKGFVISGIGVLIMAGVIYYNGALDQAKPNDQETRVVRMEVTTSRGVPHYSVRVESWRPGHDTEKVPVNYDVFSSLHPGETVHVEVHPGSFGLAWIGHVRAA